MSTPSGSVLWLDYETFSKVDIRKCGADVYARHSSTEALMLGWAVDNGPAQVWDIAAGDLMPAALFPFIYLGQGIIRAYNAPFEIGITRHVLGHHIDIKQWQCCQVLAYSMSFAGGLKNILQAVGFDEDMQKDKDGHRLIMKFCKPQPKNHKVNRWTRDTAPDDWTKFVEYCRQDVETFRALWLFLEPYNSMDAAEWDLWRIDRDINQRGLPLDLPLISSAIEVMGVQKELLKFQLQQLTGLENTSRNPLLKWINDRIESPLLDLKKETKENAYKSLPVGKAKDALAYSLLIAQASSSSKWNALDRRSVDGTLRDTLQFAGAGRTRRWAGRGVQLQNLKRSTKTMDADILSIRVGVANMTQISTCIRGAFKAPKGKMLAVSDLGSIESRVIGWLTKCRRINDIFATGGDTYIDLAAEIFETPHKIITKEQRTFAKPAALGCAYQLGAKGLQRYAEGMGVDMKEEVAAKHVAAFRGIYPEIPGFWYWLKDAIFHVVRNRAYAEGYRIQIYIEGDFMRIQLPSGRCLNYYQPEILPRKAPWDPSKDIDAFTYMGVDQFTTQWGRISAHMGGICENIIQAIARDVMAEWIVRVDVMRNINIIGHVHDEIITLVPDHLADKALVVISESITSQISWAPGLILTAEGYISTRYRKD